ncbi:MAG: hypothetical protein FWE63_02815 [Bacteroidales bacterium]|nr:hypothetical protein [Bacteroidales bacterium]
MIIYVQIPKISSVPLWFIAVFYIYHFVHFKEKNENILSEQAQGTKRKNRQLRLSEAR